MCYVNLLQETIDFLKTYKKSPTDILWIGDKNFYTNWVNFAEIAEYTNYDNGFGSNEIPMDLVVVGKDFWLSRYEYDGSEHWVFNTLPKRPIKEDKLIKFIDRTKEFGEPELIWS
jgi:hypothetical protein